MTTPPRNRVLLLLLAVLALALNPSAQIATGSVAGTVVIYTTEQPVADAIVLLTSVSESGAGLTSQTRTDSEGGYRVNVPPGRYHIKVGFCTGLQLGHPCSSSGPNFVFHPATSSRSAATIVTVAAGATGTVNFRLSPDLISSLRAESDRLDSQRRGLWDLRKGAPAKTAGWSSLDAMHRYFVAAFIATPGMGSGRVGGMMLLVDPAQLLSLEEDEGASSRTPSSAGDNAWRVSQLELIGIAKHKEPVVFAHIAHGPLAEGTRPLSDFEQKAIASLRRGGSVITRQTASEIQMVGAIRAGSACLQCHNPYREGDLLGAFRYILQRANSGQSTAPR